MTLKKVFSNSLPKAGTHLIGKCLDLFGYRHKGHLGSGLVLGGSPTSHLRRWIFPPRQPGYILGIDTPVEVSRFLVEGILNKIESGQYCTAHVGYTCDLVDRVEELGFASILVLRDPRAVLASFVPYVLKNKTHFLHNTFQHLSREEQYKAALNGTFGPYGALQPLWLRCNSLLPWIKMDNILKIRFEDIVGPKGGGTAQAQEQAMEKLCKWIDVPLDRISFVSEKLFGPGKQTFRKGQVDSWQEEIPPAVLRMLDEHLGDVLLDWGYR